MTPKTQTKAKVRTRAKSPILEVVHETARDLHRLGLSIPIQRDR